MMSLHTPLKRSFKSPLLHLCLNWDLKTCNFALSGWLSWSKPFGLNLLQTRPQLVWSDPVCTKDDQYYHTQNKENERIQIHLFKPEDYATSSQCHLLDNALCILLGLMMHLNLTIFGERLWLFSKLYDCCQKTQNRAFSSIIMLASVFLFCATFKPDLGGGDCWYSYMGNKSLNFLGLGTVHTAGKYFPVFSSHFWQLLWLRYIHQQDMMQFLHSDHVNSDCVLSLLFVFQILCHHV